MITYNKTLLNVIVVSFFLLLVNNIGFAQNQYRSKALFILDIAPDARSAGMGDVGVSTSADAISQRWNASKYIFAGERYGASLSYTPWLNKISKGMNMGLLSGYARIGDRHAIGVSATYLSIGGIELYSMEGDYTGEVSSEEYAIDVSYSHRLGEHFSGGITLRYANAIKVESAGAYGVLRPSPAFAGDISFFYTKPIEAFGKETTLSAGTVISNLGTKVKISSASEQFLPMNWRLGGTWSIPFNANNSLAASLELNKSLVPEKYDDNTTVIDAIGKSFGDGRDFLWGLGLEYSFMNTAMLRAGYHNSRFSKGNRYFTLGAGLKYQSFKIDASYLISTSSVSTPLSNTFRVSLSFLWN